MCECIRRESRKTRKPAHQAEGISLLGNGEKRIQFGTWSAWQLCLSPQENTIKQFANSCYIIALHLRWLLCSVPHYEYLVVWFFFLAHLILFKTKLNSESICYHKAWVTSLPWYFAEGHLENENAKPRAKSTICLQWVRGWDDLYKCSVRSECHL